MSTTTKQTRVIPFLNLVWENANKATAHSWERLNHAMRQALQLAIGAGFEFSPEDLVLIASNYRSGYWIGEGTEWIYRLAVEVGNASAVASYEAWKGREPFIADEVSIPFAGAFTHASHVARQRERLCVGAEFVWKGHKVQVTSFGKDGSYLVACSYQKPAEGEYGRKVARRFRITRGDLIVDRAERKERGGLLARLNDLAKEAGKAQALTEALGAKTKEEFERLPLAKIRRVLASFEGAP